MGKLVRWLFHWLFITATVLLALGMLGPQYYTPREQTDIAIGRITQGHEFNLAQWEIESVQHKLQAFIQQPAADLPPTEATELVRGYMQRAQQIGQLEQTIVAQLALQSAANHAAPTANRRDDPPPELLDIDALQTELDDLRTQQNAERMTVEQIIQQ
ncbi:MAG: hypothetical protein R2911_45950, partial [Caldilineaceae bacterium]